MSLKDLHSVVIHRLPWFGFVACLALFISGVTFDQALASPARRRSGR